MHSSALERALDFSSSLLTANLDLLNLDDFLCNKNMKYN